MAERIIDKLVTVYETRKGRDDTAGILRGLDRLGSRATEIAGKVNRAMLLVGTALVSGTALLGRKMFTESEALNSLASAMLKNIGQVSKDLLDTMREEARTGVFTFVEVIQGAEQLIRAGFSEMKAEQLLPIMADFASAAKLLPETAAGIFAKVASISKAGPKEAEAWMDRLIKASTLARTDVEELGRAIHKWLGPALAQDMDPDTILAFAAASVDAAGTAELGMEKLRASTVRLLNPSLEAQKAMEALGVSTEEIQNLTASGQFAKALDMLSMAGVFESNTAAYEIFDARTASFAMQLADRTEQVEEFRVAIEGSGGALTLSARAMEYGFFGAVKKAQSALDGLISAIGDKVFQEGGQASNLLGAFTQAITNLTENEDAIKAIANVLTIWIQVFGNLVALLATEEVASKIERISQALLEFTADPAKMETAGKNIFRIMLALGGLMLLGPVIGIITNIATVLGVLGTAIGAIATAFGISVGAVLLLALAVAGAAWLIISHWNQIVDSFQQFWQNLEDIWSDNDGFWTNVWQSAEMAWNAFITWLTVEPIKEIQEWWTFFKIHFPKTASWIELRIFSPFVTAWNRVINWLNLQGGRVDTWWEQFKTDHPKVGAWMEDNVVSPVKKNWGEVINTLILEIAKLIPGIGPLIALVVMASSIETAWKGMGQFFTTTVQDIKDAWAGIGPWFTAKLQPVIDLVATLQQKFNDLKASLGIGGGTSAPVPRTPDPANSRYAGGSPAHMPRSMTRMAQLGQFIRQTSSDVMAPVTNRQLAPVARVNPIENFLTGVGDFFRDLNPFHGRAQPVLATAGGPEINQTFNVYAARGQSPDQIAEAIRRVQADAYQDAANNQDSPFRNG